MSVDFEKIPDCVWELFDEIMFVTTIQEQGHPVECSDLFSAEAIAYGWNPPLLKPGGFATPYGIAAYAWHKLQSKPKTGLPPDGTEYMADTLPAEYRADGKREGEPLTAEYTQQELLISGSDLSKYGEKGVITHYVRIGRKHVYLFREVEELRRIKTENQDNRR